MQSVMLRMLTSSRPGHIRFMIVDPVGLGENFSAFMHLADFDERLVSNRIWTESSHIDRQLLDLTEHMENVIQVYLRNEFDTIQRIQRVSPARWPSLIGYWLWQIFRPISPSPPSAAWRA